MSGTGTDTWYLEPLGHYRTRRYAALALSGAFMVALAGLVIAPVLEVLIGVPEVGARSFSLPTWGAVLGLGVLGILFFASLFITAARRTRRASIHEDGVILGRDRGALGERLGLGGPRLPARIATEAIRRFRLERYEPMRTFPAYRWYRFWRAELELTDGHVVRLDPSVEGLSDPRALDALVELASRLKERGVEVEVRDAGPFRLSA